MIEKKQIHTEDINIEQHLTPRCEFHVSSDFKDRVMAEARSIRKRHRRRWVPYLAFSGAAAAVAIIVMVTIQIYKMGSNAETPQVTATNTIQPSTPSDSLKMNRNIPLLAETTPDNYEKETLSETIHQKRERVRKTKSAEPTMLDLPEESDPQPVTEGEMPMTNKETSLDPDEVRSRLIETRRNADIAFIERMRDEIEANQAYIAQLMTEENVYQ
ncbi:MAG: hypothetical protein K2K32_03835 [Muribaculaceae bacterium]|nr:hypothetical protein [Muribaculaceae bacterium]